jgi:hypothetical protein
MPDQPGVARRTSWRLPLFACALAAGFSLATMSAQAAGTPTRNAAARTASSEGGGQYYIEFRSRYAWDYGHTYLIHARVGEKITAANVAGLHPAGEDPTPWVIGHFIPVPSETGASDGDTEEKYVSARYRINMNKAEYDRVMVYIRQLQAHSPMWSAELYNCNAFVADIAKHMGLKVPSSTLIYPKVFITNLRKINTGHPEAAEDLVNENVKEMSSPTRDGRAMIVSGIHTVRAVRSDHAERRPAAPTVTIGPVRVTNRTTTSVVAAEPSP